MAENKQPQAHPHGVGRWILVAVGAILVGLGIYAAVKPKSKVRQEADQICEAMQRALSKIHVG